MHPPSFLPPLAGCRPLALLVPIAWFAACGADPAGTGSLMPDVVELGDGTGSGGAADAARDTAVPPRPEQDTGIDPLPGDVGRSDVPDSAGGLLGPGERCESDDACESGQCVTLGGAGGSVDLCTELCSSNDQCPEGSTCVLLVNSGTDAQQVCLPTAFCFDEDGDRFGIGPGCRGPDCDDTDGTTFPGARERCDGVDNNCDGEVDEFPIDAGQVCETGFQGQCGEGSTVCVDGGVQCRQLREPADEVCNGLDDNCNGEVDEGNPTSAPRWFRDADGDGFGDSAVSVQACGQPAGFVDNATDCDDTRTDVFPGAPEVCDGVDNNCDRRVDIDAVDAPVFFLDNDGDGFGNPRASVRACTRPEGYVADNTDCNDNCGTCFPTAVEVCDGVDNDCNGAVDEGSPANATRWYADADEDGFGDPDVSVRTCARPDGFVADNRDCNDADPAINPDARERCDGVDNNCNGFIDGPESIDALPWYADTDGDRFGNPGASRFACTRPDGFVADNTDCNDSCAVCYPGAPEICDGLDNNCNGDIDEDGATGERTFWQDADGDGFGNPLVTLQACRPPAGWVDNNRDCNDGDAAISPEGVEVCDGVDNNCNGQVDEDTAADAPTWYLDADRDGFGNPQATRRACSRPSNHVADNTDCNDSCAICFPGAREICDTLDNNCDGRVDEAGSDGETQFFRDADGDGFGNPAVSVFACVRPAGHVTNNRDCDDTRPAVNPNGIEVCDGLDNNCNGVVDEDTAVDAPTWFLDADRDGFGNPQATRRACSQPANHVANNTDCDDGCALCFPGAPERCDGRDNNCNGQVDEAGAIGETRWYRDADNDRYGNPSVNMLACNQPAGFVADNTDCNDANPNANPGIAFEVCDNVDNNCDGRIDEDLIRQCSTACGSGSETCSAGAWVGCTAPPVRPEVCDRQDNDCNGLVDDGLVCRQAVHRLRRFVANQPIGIPPRALCPAGASREQNLYLYSLNPNEGVSVGWQLDVLNAFWLYSTQVPGTLPFYRCYNPNFDRFFLTFSPVCELWDDPTMVQGILGYAATGPANDVIALFRSVSEWGLSHFYTTNTAEYQEWANCRAYFNEGVGAYVWGN